MERERYYAEETDEVDGHGIMYYAPVYRDGDVEGLDPSIGCHGCFCGFETDTDDRSGSLMAIRDHIAEAQREAADAEAEADAQADGDRLPASPYNWRGLEAEAETVECPQEWENDLGDRIPHPPHCVTCNGTGTIPKARNAH